MSLTTSEMTPADIAAVTGGGGYGSYGNNFGGDGWWIILFLILAMGGNWGNNGFGGGNGGGWNGSIPWILNNDNDIERGFDQQATMGALSALQSSVSNGFANASTQLCNCCADIQQSLCNGFAGVEAGANARQIANMNQAFGMQTAMMQGFNGIQSQFADCCCENRLGLADLKYTVATEACADRSAINEALRDVISANTASTQRILDQLCSDKLEQKNDIINQLRSELMYARGQASQDVQTATIQAGQRALANEVEQYVLPTPRPAYIVANPACCNQNTGCGCGNF